ncbi:MAG: two-component regulator propeller domain-containing protein, partial [Bacteroidota bacterium]
MRFTLHVALLRVTAALLRRGRTPALVALVVAGLLGVPEGASQHARGTAVDVAAPGFLAKRWTTADGLPVNHITSLHFAQDGYLWMTTFDGLVRFDGHRFTVFNTANSPNMTSNRLVALHEAPDGALWLRTEGGGLLRRADDRFEAFPGVEGATGSFFFQDADTLWMTATQGLFRYDPAAGLRQAYPHVIDEPVTDVIRDYAGALWVYGRRTLYRFDPHADASQPAAVHTFTAADGLPGVEGLLFNPFKPGVLFDAGSERDGPALWVGMPSGLVRWDGTRFEQPFADAPYWDDSHVMSIQSGPDGRIWFGTTRYGWLVYDGERLEMEVPSERTTPGFQGLGLAIAEDGAVWHTQQGWLYRDTTPVLRLERPGHLFFRPTAIDPEGNLWVGEDGLFRVQRRAVHTVSRDDGLPSDQVYPVLQARDGAFWLGAWAVRGLTRWHEGAPTQYGLTEHDARAQDFTTALHEDAAGRLWVGTLGRMGYLAPTQPGGERFRVLDAPVDDVYLTHVSALHTDRAGYLWAGSERGVVRLRQTGGMPTEGIHEEGPGTWAATAFDLSVPVRRVEELRDGSVLVGTLGSGIGRYRSVASGRDAEVGHDAGAFEWLTTADGLASDFVRDLYEDAEGFLWIVTQDRGLCRLDRRAEASLRDAARAGGLACVDTRHGLFDNSLHRVLEDDAGRLWLSSNRGLFWATRADLDAALRGVRPSVAVVSYTERDGMRNREANGGRQPAGLRAADGRLWFPTQGGVVVVDPNEVAAPKPVPVRMETAVVGGATLPLSAGALTLPAGTRDLDVRYAGLAFGRPEAVRYRVRLDGYDAAWRAPTHSTTATYTNLPPGRYTLRVEASLGGAWSAPATLDITRPPRFWETGLFVLLAVALVGLAGVALFRQRVRHLTKRQAVLENTVEA